MTPPRSRHLFVVGLLVMAGGLVTTAVRLPEWSALHDQVGVLRHTLAAETAPPEPPSRPDRESPPPKGSDLTEAERMELLGLRGEWLPLRRQAEELASLQQTNADLQQRLADARAHPEDVAPVIPAGWIPAQYARNAGQATPEAALETWVWAIKNRDKETFLRTVAPEIAAVLAKTVFLDPAKEEGFWKQQEILESMQVRSKQAHSTGTVELEVVQVNRLHPAQANERFVTVTTIPARLVDGQWRILMR